MCILGGEFGWSSVLICVTEYYQALWAPRCLAWYLQTQNAILHLRWSVFIPSTGAPWAGGGVDLHKVVLGKYKCHRLSCSDPWHRHSMPTRLSWNANLTPLMYCIDITAYLNEIHMHNNASLLSEHNRSLSKLYHSAIQNHVGHYGHPGSR